MRDDAVISALLGRLTDLRERAGLTSTELDKRLGLGPGWVERFESGSTLPALDVLLVMLREMKYDLPELVDGISAQSKGFTNSIVRTIYAERSKKDPTAIHIRFQYSKYDASYLLPNATVEQFREVIQTMRDGLAKLTVVGAEDEQVKTQAVANTFLAAVQRWPDASPSDLWWFVVMRAFQDPFNHPAMFARLDLGQSWKRTGGWALEDVLVRAYSEPLAKHGITLFVAHGADKTRYVKQLQTGGELEPDKVDVFLLGDDQGDRVCFGVVHVKASFAERRTDDVPMSRPLVEAGYCSPLWTMDCKSAPGANPVNRGELGKTLQPSGPDKRSAKRKDVEDAQLFSACFSYNHNTHPTPAAQKARARVYSIPTLRSPKRDVFIEFLCSEWDRFRREKLGYK